MPRVNEGAAVGSAAITRTLRPPRNAAPMNGKVNPAKFEPPPVQPTKMSGSTPAISSWSCVSCPITVWCSRTWFSTEPKAYLVSSRVAASSTASLIAMPSDPEVFGSDARTERP